MGDKSTFIMMSCPPFDWFAASLHPEDPSEIVVDFSWALTVRAACEEAACVRLCASTKHELVGMTSAAGAGFAPKLPANSSDLAHLFVHFLH